jgi:hypothetical protein
MTGSASGSCPGRTGPSRSLLAGRCLSTCAGSGPRQNHRPQSGAQPAVVLGGAAWLAMHLWATADQADPDQR